MIPKFPLGRLVGTPGAIEALKEAVNAGHYVTGAEYVGRHASGDWGEMDAEDTETNNIHLKEGGRLFSAYTLPTGVKLWIITEADRSVTTLLLPDEY